MSAENSFPTGSEGDAQPQVSPEEALLVAQLNATNTINALFQLCPPDAGADIDLIREEMVKDLTLDALIIALDPDQTPYPDTKSQVERFWLTVWFRFFDPLTDMDEGRAMLREQLDYMCNLARTLHSEEEMGGIPVYPELTASESTDIVHTTLDKEGNVQTQGFKSLLSAVSEWEERQDRSKNTRQSISNTTAY